MTDYKQNTPEEWGFKMVNGSSISGVVVKEGDNHVMKGSSVADPSLEDYHKSYKIDLTPYIKSQESYEKSYVNLHQEKINQVIDQIVSLNEKNAEQAMIVELNRRIELLTEELGRILGPYPYNAISTNIERISKLLKGDFT